MMLNGRFYERDSGEKIVGSLGNVRTRKGCRRGELGTIAQRGRKSSWKRGGGKFESPGGHFSVLGSPIMRKSICKYLIWRVLRGNFL